MVKLRRPEPFIPPPGSYLLGFGEQRFVGKRDRIWLTPGLAASHMLVIGQTGSGKTKLIESVCRQFLSSGQGFCLLDLHGDLATDLRDYAAGIESEPIWLDAADPARTVTFNPLDPGRGEGATQVLELIAAFRRHWSDSWGPRLADLLTHTLGVLQANGLTLCEVPLLLGSQDIRERLLLQADQAARDYFYLRFNPLSRRDQIMISESTMNKVGALLSDYRVRTFVGDAKPTLRPHTAIAEGRTVLARIPRGALVENADLLASLLLAAFHTAALSRVGMDPAKRTPYVMVLDEAQIASETFPQLLSGARAFGLSAICGIQYLDLLPQPLAEAMLANCRTRVCFTSSRRDAERLARELFRADGDHVKYRESDFLGGRKSKPIYWSTTEEWEYAMRELQDQHTGECVIQLGRELPWFAETVPLEDPSPSSKELKQLAGKTRRLTRSRTEIADAIARRRRALYETPINHTEGGDAHDDTVEPLPTA